MPKQRHGEARGTESGFYSKAQEVLLKRGYLVVATFEELKVGEIIEHMDFSEDPFERDDRDIKAVVIGETDRQDHIEQGRLVGLDCWVNPDDLPRYYRVVLE